MANPDRPENSGDTRPGGTGEPGLRDDELDRRRRELGATLATRLPKKTDEEHGSRPGGASGYAQAFKLSSEFIAGIAVGVGLGWGIDRFFGTSPWGLVVFLLLGFAAGVLNVMRSVGKVAEFGQRSPKDRDT